METRILKALAAIGAASLLLASVGVFFDSNTAFYWLPHRAWELLTGACLACIPPSWYPAAAQRTMVKWAGWCGLVMILVSGLVYRETTIFPGLAALPPCLGAVAIIWANLGANQQLSGVGRLLSRKPLVMIGLSSYSLYLWHWPLFAFARYLAADSDEGLSVGLRWGIIGASILLAFGSLCLIETPVRKKYILKSRKAVLGFGLVSSLGCGALAYGLVQSQGMPERVSSQARAYAEAKFDIPGNWSATWVTVADAQQGRFKVIGKARDDQPPAIMLWGDSHARCLIPAFENWCDSRGIYGVAAVHNTLSPTLGYYRKAKTGLNEKALLFGDAVLEHVRSQRIRHTVVTAYWQKCAQRDPHAFSEALKRTAQAFKEAGSELTVILDVPAQKFDVPKALALSAWLPAFPDPRQEVVSVIKHREANQIMYELKPELEKMRIRVLDPLPLLSERHDEEGAAAETTLIAAEGASLYFDRHHVSRMGALRIAPLLAPLFEHPPQ